MARSNSRGKILDAAEIIICEHGAARLTLDGVAEQAGVSKGGLLYNFPSKEALLHALVERQCMRFSAGVHGDPAQRDPAASFLRYVASTLERSDEQDRVATGLLAVLAHDPHLLGPMRSQYREWVQELRTLGPQFTAAAVPWLAAEGLWLLEVMHVLELEPPVRAGIRAAILDGAGAAVGQAAGSEPPLRAEPAPDQEER